MGFFQKLKGWRCFPGVRCWSAPEPPHPGVITWLFLRQWNWLLFMGLAGADGFHSFGGDGDGYQFVCICCVHVLFG